MDQVGLHPPQDAGELQHGAHVLGGAHRLDQVGARDELGTGIFRHVVEEFSWSGPAATATTSGPKCSIRPARCDCAPPISVRVMR
jgi:hypothetical protein